MNNITISSGSNGYPANLRAGWVDFENFDEAAEYAAQIGGRVVYLRRRDGWAFWEELGTAFEPYRLDIEDLRGQDTVAEFVTASEAEAWRVSAHELVEELAEYEGTTAEELAEELAMVDKTAAELLELPADRRAIVEGLQVVDVVPLEVMGYYYDVWAYAVGVVEE